MKNDFILQIELLSDASFGRGDGLAGLVDSEVEHDPRTGLPYVRGRVIKGLLVEECANILFALTAQKHSRLKDYEQAAAVLFGAPGSSDVDAGSLNVGPAGLPKALEEAISAELNQSRPSISPAQVLESLTGIRRQTAMDDETGAPDENSLRASRVMLRGLVFEAGLFLETGLSSPQQALLAACVMAVRRGGLARNRGRGKLKMSLLVNGADRTSDWYQSFKTSILGESR